MELILIDPSKLKIMLTAPDMQHYALDTSRLEGMACTDTHTREAFRHIFHDAEVETGFHTDGQKLLVQMYTSKCGGCEIFVTKLGDEASLYKEAPHHVNGAAIGLSPNESNLIRRALTCKEDPYAEARAKEASSVQHLPSSEANPTSAKHRKSTRKIIVSVENLDTLLSVCRRLLSVGYANPSSAYIEKNQTPPTCHLCLEVPDGVFYTLDETYAFLKEYGTVNSHRHASLLLEEHGQVIRKKDAVSVLGVL